MSLPAFFLLYNKAREKAITLGNIQAGFEATGLLPIDEARIFKKLGLDTHEESNPVTNNNFELATSILLGTLGNQQAPSTPRQEKAIRPIVLAANQLSSSARELTYTMNHPGSKKVDLATTNATLIATNSSLAATTSQISSLLKVTTKAAQQAMVQRDLYKIELAKLRQQIQDKPQEAVVDARRRDYGELLTAEDVLMKRREDAEKALQEQAAKEQRAVEREERAMANLEAEAERVRKREEKERQKVAREEREQEERETKAREREEKAKERQRQKEEREELKRLQQEERKAELEANRQLRLEQVKKQPPRRQTQGNLPDSAASDRLQTIPTASTGPESVHHSPRDHQQGPAASVTRSRRKLSQSVDPPSPSFPCQKPPSTVELVVGQARTRAKAKEKDVKEAIERIVEVVDETEGLGSRSESLVDVLAEKEVLVPKTRRGRVVKKPGWRDLGL